MWVALHVYFGWLGKTSSIRWRTEQVNPIDVRDYWGKRKVPEARISDVFEKQQESQGGQIRVSKRGREGGRAETWEEPPHMGPL